MVLADVGRGDWVLCQITSNPYADALAVEITAADFSFGALRAVSYARPGKLFTASDALITSELGVLNSVAFRRVLDAVVNLLDP